MTHNRKKITKLKHEIKTLEEDERLELKEKMLKHRLRRMRR